MDISERKRGDRQKLARLIARESNAMQRDRLRSVLLVLQGRQTLEVSASVGRSRAFVQRWAYAYRDGGIEAVQGRTPPGRRPRLSPEQETRFVQRVKAGPTPRDGVASLRGRQIRGRPSCVRTAASRSGYSRPSSLPRAGHWPCHSVM